MGWWLQGVGIGKSQQLTALQTLALTWLAFYWETPAGGSSSSCAEDQTQGLEQAEHIFSV